uniref:Uncharacterized protein n=1 Tax=Anguilla anguilla TaxID=7936 RepID=A0A0E9WR84_ANGAN
MGFFTQHTFVISFYRYWHHKFWSHFFFISFLLSTPHISFYFPTIFRLSKFFCILPSCSFF